MDRFRAHGVGVAGQLQVRDHSSIELEIRRQVARIAARDLAQVDGSSWVTSYHIDSLDLLLLRESIERALGIVIGDDVWLRTTSITKLAAHIVAGRPDVDRFSTSVNATAGHTRQGLTGTARQLDTSGTLSDEIEIGMSLTGQANLAETPLLKYLGDLRWSHLSALSGVPSRAVVDADGHRLYPAFFYVDLAFPGTTPMACFGENDRLGVRATLGRFGESMLDGTTYFFNPQSPIPADLIGEDVTRAAQAGFPAARLTNVFVNRHGGSEWLKRSLPANPGFDRVPSLADVPESFHRVRAAERVGRFRLPDARYVALTGEPVIRDIPIVPERDLNGAGLVYFANFPLFLDICEREVLLAGDHGFSAAAVGLRTLVRRQSAYLHNASLDDILRIETHLWTRPLPEHDWCHGKGAISVLANARMWRRSDGRLMMLSSAEKLLPVQAG